MPDLAYGEVYAMNRMEARRRPVETQEETGSVRETARRWPTSRRAVRKWVRWYREEGEAGLGDRSRGLQGAFLLHLGRRQRFPTRERWATHRVPT